MKTLLTPVVTTLFTFCFAISTWATTRTVSNNPNIPAQFSNLQTAINESASGDTLLVHGSPNDYGNVTINRSMVLIGPGYRPLGQNQLTAIIGNLNVVAPTDGVSDNVALIGLNIGTLRQHEGGCASGFATKLRIVRCVVGQYLPRGVASGVNDSEFFAEQCIFIGATILNNNDCGGPAISSAILNNSIFTSALRYDSPVSNGLVANCIFFGGGSSLQQIQNTIFSNNVFYGTQLSDGNGAKTGCTFNNNLTFGTNNNALAFASSITLGTLENTDPLFINATAPGNGQNFSTLFNGVQNLNPQPASPLLAAGSDGTNIGTTGGSSAFNYLLQGTTKGPWMTSLLINNASLPENGTLQVTFGAKAQE
jgi:hypothetical protein